MGHDWLCQQDIHHGHLRADVTILSMLVTESGSEQVTPTPAGYKKFTTIIEMTTHGIQEDSRKLLRDVIIKMSHAQGQREVDVDNVVDASHEQVPPFQEQEEHGKQENYVRVHVLLVGGGIAKSRCCSMSRTRFQLCS